MADHFSLRWNNFHRNMSAGFRSLLMEDTLVDVTLAADGRFVQAHRLVLSVCSPYFKNLFSITPCNHPIVIMKDVNFKQLTDILSFMYQGEVNVHQEELADFLKTAELLQIRGLADQNIEEVNTATLTKLLSQPPCPQHSGLHQSNSSLTKAEEKKRMKVGSVQVTSEQRLVLPERTSLERPPAANDSRAPVQKLVHQSTTVPAQVAHPCSAEGPTTSMFAGVPVKEELPDVPSDAEPEMEAYEFLPSVNHVPDANVQDTPIILHDGGSGESQVTERDLWNAPPTQEGLKKSTRNQVNGDKEVSSTLKQQKISRHRRQRTLALNKIRRFLVAPKRSRRIAFARKMKRKKETVFKSTSAMETVTDVSKELASISRNATNVKNLDSVEPHEQDLLYINQAGIENTSSTTNESQTKKAVTLEESKKLLKGQNAKKRSAQVVNVKQKRDNAEKKKEKSIAHKSKRGQVNSNSYKKNSTNSSKKISPLRKGNRKAHINRQNSATDSQGVSPIKRKKIIVVIAAKKAKSAVALARRMQSPVKERSAISNQSGNLDRVASGVTVHLRSSDPQVIGNAKDLSGGIVNGSACRHLNCLGCREGN